MRDEKKPNNPFNKNQKDLFWALTDAVYSGDLATIKKRLMPELYVYGPMVLRPEEHHKYEYGPMVLCAAAHHGKTNIVEWFFELAKEDDAWRAIKDAYGLTAIHLAGAGDAKTHTTLYDWMRENYHVSMHVDERALAKSTLHYAANGGNTPLLRWMLAPRLAGGRGTLASNQDERGTTALAEAIAHGHYHCAQLLLEAGASPYQLDRSDKLPIDYLRDDCPPEIAHVLKSQIRFFEALFLLVHNDLQDAVRSSLAFAFKHSSDTVIKYFENLMDNHYQYPNLSRRQLSDLKLYLSAITRSTPHYKTTHYALARTPSQF